MTREEAHEKLYDRWSDEIHYNSNQESPRDIINIIYDDFESRVCENCKHYKEDKIFEDTRLDCAANEAGQNIVSYPPIDFGCNKWESK